MSTRPTHLALGASLAVAAAVAAPALAASPAASPAPADVSGHVSVYGFGVETSDEIAQVRVQHVKERYPGLDLQFSETGFEEQAFLAALSGSSKPDVVSIPRNILGTYAAKGVLEPVDDCMARMGVDPAVFQPAALSQVQLGGKTYGFPQFLNTREWFINAKAFQDAGLDPATFDFSDWNAIADANTKMTTVDNGLVTRIGIDPKLPEFLPLWAKANGAAILSDDGATSQLDDPKVAEALSFAASLLQPAGGQAPFNDFKQTWDFFGAGNELATDQVGAFPMEQWYLNVLAENSPDAPIVVRPFVDRQGNPVTWADGDAFAIVAGTPNEAAACAFAAAMTEKDAWVAAAKARAAARAKDGKPFTGTYTGNIAADEEIFSTLVDLSKMPAFADAVKVIVDGQKHAFSIPASAAAAEFDDAWMNAATDAITNGTDPTQALAAADQTAQQALDTAASR